MVSNGNTLILGPILTIKKLLIMHTFCMTYSTSLILPNT